MDSALKLKIAYDKGEIETFAQAEVFINQSELIAQLLQQEDFDTLALMNRLIELSEIPFVGELPIVKKWLDELVKRSFFGGGFSYSGKSDEMLVCYNAMISSLLVRLSYHNRAVIERGIDWIIQYQHFERGLKNQWEGKSIFKYGGCMKSTPCYVGVVKSTIALSDYVHRNGYVRNKVIEQKLEKGLEYILSHRLYLKQSIDKPITSYLSKVIYPFTYKISIVELLRLMHDNQKLQDERCLKAKEWLFRKRKSNGGWVVHSVPNPKYWIVFDKPKEQGNWISYEIGKLFES